MHIHYIVVHHRLPLQIGENISIECYNTYLIDRESNAYKLERENNGDVFIIEMPLDEHEAIAWYIDTCCMHANGANPPNKLPIRVNGATSKVIPNLVYP